MNTPHEKRSVVPEEQDERVMQELRRDLQTLTRTLRDAKRMLFLVAIALAFLLLSYGILVWSAPW